jgi:hypothetical protein
VLDGAFPEFTLLISRFRRHRSRHRRLHRNDHACRLCSSGDEGNPVGPLETPMTEKIEEPDLEVTEPKDTRLAVPSRSFPC